jgi:hypothetical protein
MQQQKILHLHMAANNRTVLPMDPSSPSHDMYRNAEIVEYNCRTELPFFELTEIMPLVKPIKEFNSNRNGAFPKK